MKSYAGGLMVLLVAAGAQGAPVGDMPEGKRLHDAKCMSCHDTRVYTRKDRQIKSLEALKQQMESCGHMAKIELAEPEKQSLVKYLNTQFYHFP